ncbi:MAG TPA: tRNA 2-selenouridine(34) synthase MnmH [Flavisolibacter sp.]
MAERLLVRDFMAKTAGNLLLDVRSPLEFSHAHIPGAVSLPLFTDDERKVVGTAYKQQGKQQAIKLGLDFFAPKMRPMVEEVERLLGEFDEVSGRNPTICMYCWRGGMRSAAVAWLLELYGFRVLLLAGGYKSFRNLVLSTFEIPYRFRVLGGFTGSGKTEILKALGNEGAPVIDLEQIASHKGSAFGSINMPPQPTQEMFENILGTRLLGLANTPGPIWIEDESQRIGTVNVPNSLWQNMRSSPIVFLEIPFEERLGHLVAEYGPGDHERLRSAIERITKRLGGLETKNALAALDENRISDCFSILLKYYDKHYLKGLHNREGLEALLQRIPCERVSEDNALLLSAKPMIA